MADAAVVPAHYAELYWQQRVGQPEPSYSVPGPQLGSVTHFAVFHLLLWWNRLVRSVPMVRLQLVPAMSGRSNQHSRQLKSWRWIGVVLRLVRWGGAAHEAPRIPWFCDEDCCSVMSATRYRGDEFRHLFNLQQWAERWFGVTHELPDVPA